MRNHDLPDDGVDSSDLVPHLPRALEAPAVLHRKVLAVVVVLGEVGVGLAPVEPLGRLHGGEGVGAVRPPATTGLTVRGHCFDFAGFEGRLAEAGEREESEVYLLPSDGALKKA